MHVQGFYYWVRYLLSLTAVELALYLAYFVCDLFYVDHT
jgi:hypothetical protein